MTRRRWIADEVSGDLAYLRGQNAAHLAQVLRAEVGQELEVSTGVALRLGRISKIGKDRVELLLGEVLPSPAIPDLTLLLAIFRFDRLEWAIEKATELGAAEIVPVIARRTDVHLAQAARKRVERWRRIAHEASQQSRRVSSPVVTDPLKLKDALATPATVRIVLTEGVAQTLKAVLAASPQKESLALAVGPEGGWTSDEIALYQNSGWIPAGLGPGILRSETAAMVALAVVSSELARA
ncbi:MAG TPA: RsmE family RNA methyltransferase [Terriglobales bacterium]|nr:RsmE family RNA methyltransferase [Terriglobales bacterium]